MFDKQNFKDTFSQVHASEALLTEVLNMTTEQKPSHRPVRHIGRTLLIAAVLICVLSVSVMAAAGATGIKGDVSDALDSFFGNSGDYAEGTAIVKYDDMGQLETNLPAWSREPMDLEVANRLVAPYLYTLEQNTVTKGGFTYTIHAILWDSNTGANLIYWSVENPDGLGDYGVGENGEFFTLESSQMYAVICGRNYIDTVNSTDTKLYLSGYNVDWDEELWCELGLRISLDQKPDTQRITLPRSDRGGMQALRFGDSITMSPVGIRFENTDSVDLSELIIIYHDGSEYVVFSDEQFVDNTTYGLNSSRGDVTYTFNRIVDVETVSGILVNGALYPAA